MTTYEQEKNNSPPERGEAGEAIAAAAVLPKVRRNNTFILDSGATSHMCFNPDMFFKFTRQTDSYLMLEDDKPAKITGKGSVRITVPDEEWGTKH
ncbi:hypothetical protein JTE90_025003 [Oedothorax gibbosus]|uniref:Retrovirus-related Pol polyprotein from transposon TNT 1-94-like beta-barrel domain-containing protein n=1 Tax=Oedothorax gibbosus TaxID=931172 RepID=A0AAV6VVW8_9ARAC|nr:hypothetical protein JTE90_025003 [Oedothorax gibbosus]